MLSIAASNSCRPQSRLPRHRSKGRHSCPGHSLEDINNCQTCRRNGRRQDAYTSKDAYISALTFAISKAGSSLNHHHQLEAILQSLDVSIDPVDKHIRPHGSIVDRSAAQLSPVDETHRHLSDGLIQIVRQPDLDPMFLMISVRSAHELVQKEYGTAGEWLRRRQASLRHLCRLAPIGSIERSFLVESQLSHLIRFHCQANRAAASYGPG
jgi:hypothetical protein